MLICFWINIINIYVLDSNKFVYIIVNKFFNVCNNFVVLYSEV